LRLAEAVSSPPFLGLVLLGSFARGEADELSDVDFIAFVAEGEFERAWEQRHRLHPVDAWCWGYPRPPGDRDVAAHRWLTRDFVLFDGLIATPTGTRVADPMHVLVDREDLRRHLVIREPIASTEQTERGDQITLNEIERLYGELKRALRRAGR
jgi:hypothetical protein